MHGLFKINTYDIQRYRDIMHEVFNIYRNNAWNTQYIKINAWSVKYKKYLLYRDIIHGVFKKIEI